MFGLVIIRLHSTAAPASTVGRMLLWGLHDCITDNSLEEILISTYSVILFGYYHPLFKYKQTVVPNEFIQPQQGLSGLALFTILSIFTQNGKRTDMRHIL